MFTASQLVAHAIGDYLLQSHWMATTKVHKSLVCLLHVGLYGLPFLLLSPSITAYLVIVGTHFILDRWRLARQVCWLKNFIGPRRVNRSWNECRKTGSVPEDLGGPPDYMAVWLMIIVDNIMHVTINALALTFL